MPHVAPTDQQANAIVDAINRSPRAWRTVYGLAADTGLPAEVVLAVLTTDPRILQADAPSADGDDMYSTVEHYRRTVPIWQRVMAAVRGRA